MELGLEETDRAMIVAEERQIVSEENDCVDNHLSLDLSSDEEDEAWDAEQEESLKKLVKLPQNL
jgi:hypothetical protein